MKAYDAEMQETENLLIENYLQIVGYENVDTSITIVNEAYPSDEPIFQS